MLSKVSSLCRLTPGALLEAASRKLVFASSCRSIVLSSTTLSVEPSIPPNVPGIFDVFDAPARLQERNNLRTPLKALNPFTMRSTSKADRSDFKSMHNDTLGLPWSLPPPVIFDGPACPPHMSPSTLIKRRLQRQDITHSPRAQRFSAVSCSALTLQSELVYQLFDGPSRVTRFRYAPSENEVC